MRIPADQVHGSPTFHSRIERLPDGRYRATNVSMPQVPVQVAASESEAIAMIHQATEAWIGMGCPEKV